jgi:hypothetical protein
MAIRSGTPAPERGRTAIPGELDGDVQDALEGLFYPIYIQGPVFDPVLQVAASNVLSEDTRYVVSCAHVVTGDDMQVQNKIDPGLGFADEALPAGGFSEGLWPGAFQRQVDLPGFVVDAVDLAHAAFAEQALYFEGVEQSVSGLPLGRDARLAEGMNRGRLDQAAGG